MQEAADRARLEVLHLEQSADVLPPVCDTDDIDRITDRELAQRYSDHVGVYQLAGEYVEKSIKARTCLRNMCGDTALAFAGSKVDGDEKIVLTCELTP
jgi:hypothetical protein